jgi:hypothetical protein
MPADDIPPALDELRDACGPYEMAENYYEGTVDEVFFSPVVRRLLHGSSTNFRVNLACKPVNAVLERMEIIAVLGDTDETTQILNEQLWDANQMELEAPDVHRATLTYGDGYVFCWDGRGADLDEAEGDPSVTMLYNSPKVVRAFYDEDAPRDPRMVVKSWKETSGEHKGHRVNLYYGDLTERYVQSDSDKAAKNKFTLIDEIENPYGRVPFFHFRTRRPYGKPEHFNAYGSQDALTKLIINQLVASDFAALPQRYGLVETGQGTDDSDIDFDDEDDDDTINTLIRQPGLRSGPGTIQLLKYMKSVGQFASADVGNFLDPIDKYVHLMASTTATPMSFMDPTGNLPSGEAQRQADGPLVAKVGNRELNIGATWRDLLTFGMNKILGIPGKATVRWAPVQVLNDSVGWQTIKAKIDAGVPIRVALMEGGYTEKQVTDWGYTPEQPNGPLPKTAPIPPAA